MIVMDLEWDGNDPDRRLLVLGINGEAYPADEIPDKALRLLELDEDKLVFTKEDHRWLLEHGFCVRGGIVDAQAMCWAYDERTPLSLDWCSKEYARYDPDKRIVRAKGKVWFRCDDGELVLIGDAPIDQLCRYNQRDQNATVSIYHNVKGRLEQVGLLDYWKTMQKPFSKVLLKMELNGLPYNEAAGAYLRERLAYEAEEVKQRLYLHAKLPQEFNLGSRDQLIKLLFTHTFELPTRIKVSKGDMGLLKQGLLPLDFPKEFRIDKLGRDYVHGAFELKGAGLKPKVKAPKCKDKKCSHGPKYTDCLPSVSAKTLKVHHDHGWVKLIIEWKLLDKAMQFLDVWAEHSVNGRLRTHFKQTGTATGRLSSSDPVNLQNIPSRGRLGKEIRALFEAPDLAVLVDGDFNQIEPRLMAHFSRDPEMVRVFMKGLDLYEEATVSILGDRYPKGTPERQLIRTCFLAMGYEAQPPKIQSNLAEEGFRIPMKMVKAAYDDIVGLYQVFWDWKEELKKEAREVGYVTTIAGHRRHLDFRGEAAWKADRQVANSTIQGSAADIVADTMMECDRQLPTFWRLCLQAHDELLYQVPKFLYREEHRDRFRWIAEEMGHKYKLVVPLVFEPVVVRSWGEAK